MRTIGKLLIVIFTFLALAPSSYAADDRPLFEAIAREDKAAIEALLVKGADVNARPEGVVGGGTPLHVAASFGSKDIDLRHTVRT